VSGKVSNLLVGGWNETNGTEVLLDAERWDNHRALSKRRERTGLLYAVPILSVAVVTALASINSGPTLATTISLCLCIASIAIAGTFSVLGTFPNSKERASHEKVLEFVSTANMFSERIRRNHVALAALDAKELKLLAREGLLFRISRQSHDTREFYNLMEKLGLADHPFEHYLSQVHTKS